MFSISIITLVISIVFSSLVSSIDMFLVFRNDVGNLSCEIAKGGSFVIVNTEFPEILKRDIWNEDLVDKFLLCQYTSIFDHV